ncbi:hypothetical protein BST61_g8696 [Cercospora zeina]
MNSQPRTGACKAITRRRGACWRCRQKKIRCDGAQPLCGYCSRAGNSDCYYPSPRPRETSTFPHIEPANKVPVPTTETLQENPGDDMFSWLTTPNSDHLSVTDPATASDLAHGPHRDTNACSTHGSDQLASNPDSWNTVFFDDDGPVEQAYEDVVSRDIEPPLHGDRPQTSPLPGNCGEPHRRNLHLAAEETHKFAQCVPHSVGSLDGYNKRLSRASCLAREAMRATLGLAARECSQAERLRRLLELPQTGDMLGIDSAVAHPREFVFNESTVTRNLGFLELAFAEAGGVGQFASPAQLRRHLWDASNAPQTCDAASEALVVSVLANGALIEALQKCTTITRKDLAESFSLFQTAASAVSRPWRTHNQIVALQALLSMVVFAKSCAGHLVPQMLVHFNEILDDTDIEGFSWRSFLGAMANSPQPGLHHVFWTALFEEDALRLFQGKRSTMTDLVRDGVVHLPHADAGEYLTQASWLRAMASLHQTCAEIRAALQFGQEPPPERSMLVLITSLLSRIAEWKNGLPLGFRDLDQAAPAYLSMSSLEARQARRAGVRLTCIYYELCLTVHNAGLQSGGDWSSMAHEGVYLRLLEELFGWSSSLMAGDVLSESRLLTLCLDGCKAACALAHATPSSRLLKLLDNGLSTILKTSHLVVPSVQVDDVMMAVAEARRMCGWGHQCRVANMKTWT